MSKCNCCMTTTVDISELAMLETTFITEIVQRLWGS